MYNNVTLLHTIPHDTNFSYPFMRNDQMIYPTNFHDVFISTTVSSVGFSIMQNPVLPPRLNRD